MSCTTNIHHHHDQEAEDQHRSVYKDTNAVPRNLDQSVLHLCLREGQVANKIITVGCPGRAAKIAKYLDDENPIFHQTSPRGFAVYSGKFAGVPISIFSIGMGMAMMDFFVREARQIMEETPLLIVRYGTCGIVQASVDVGSVVVASEGSVLVQRNPDAFLPPSSDPSSPPPPLPYLIFKPQAADADLSQALVQELSRELGPTHPVNEGLNATCCSFYSSQGRQDPLFDDDNQGILDQLRAEYPSVTSMEMETFQLFALANSSKGTIRAAAASIGVANRPTGKVCSEADLEHLESVGGKAVLQALISSKNGSGRGGGNGGSK